MTAVMLRFWDLLERSIILQSLITTGFVTAAIYLWLVGREVPDPLLQGMWVTVGFWFGTKAQHAIESAATKAKG